ncbi:hypothetical protein [Roseivirga pacifica]|uniref:hypothetical protein n=1 Tax=Roseivirga pacifica TaxID=1267423 RepID=UPI00227C8725|nr:hypothetical protein [Roseivirga pacifica]
MRKFALYALLLFVTTLSVNAQRSPNDVDEAYEKENVFGIVKATSGGLISGIFYRHSKTLGPRDLSHIAFEAVNIKHPRESRVNTVTGSSFVYGKSNYLVALRPMYGREKILFRKAPQQGARISGLVAVGPSIGMEIPYYVELGGSRKEQYDPNNQGHSPGFISGKAGPFRGIGESSFVLGGFAKASLTFETNSTKQKVFGFEVGFTVDAYTREINILPLADNQSVFTAAFLAIYFGKRR